MAFSQFLYLYSKSQASPMQVLCKSHFSPILRNGLGTDLERYYNGGITEDQRKMYERIFLIEIIEIVDDKLEGFQKFQLFQLNLGILLPTRKARLREYIIFGK